MNRTSIVGFSRRAGSGGVTFYPESESPTPLYFIPKTVVITVKPQDGDATLTVREAKYIDLPPKPCSGSGEIAVCYYEWYGVDFAVYPPMGMRPIDFAGDEYNAGTSEAPIQPKLTTVFHRVHREREVWVLEDVTAKGGIGIRPAIVLTATTGAHTIHVQPAKRSGFTWIADGSAIDVPLWGTQLGEDFQTLIGLPGATEVDVIPLIQVGGEWYAMQYFWWYANTPNPALPKGDCI